MQLDLQSVRTSFGPEIVGSSSSSLQNESELSPRSISRAVSRFSMAPVAGNHRQHFFDPTGSNTITFPIGSKKTSISIRWAINCYGIWHTWIEKMLTVISCNWAPGDAGSSSGYRCWRKLRLILKWGRPTSNNFGAKAHANLLKDWKVLFQQTANPTAYRKKLALPLYQNARSYWIQYWFTNGYYISDPSGIPSYYIPFPPFYRFFAPWCLWVTLLCCLLYTSDAADE